MIRGSPRTKNRFLVKSEPRFGISDTRKLRGDPRIGPKTHKRINKKHLNKKRMVPPGGIHAFLHRSGRIRGTALFQRML